MQPARFGQILLPFLLILGCQGTIGEPTPLPAADTVPGDGVDVAQPEAEPVPDPEPAFALDQAEPELLPFRVRLARVADVLGVSIDDALLAHMRDSRIALGDHDYATGVLPDSHWSASRMALWVRVLVPVCGSTTMRLRYPAFPEALPDLIEAAYGREASSEDLSAFEVDGQLDEETAYRVVCLSVLSSAELVMR